MSQALTKQQAGAAGTRWVNSRAKYWNDELWMKNAE